MAEMARRAMSSSKSEPIMNSSRLGAALIMLIMLGGGRRIESIRTHGISQTFAYIQIYTLLLLQLMHILLWLLNVTNLFSD